MGLDWERLSLSGYMEALSYKIDSQNGGEKHVPADAAERLDRFMKAQMRGA